MTPKAASVVAALKALANPALAEKSRRYFKTEKGGYAEHDHFLGIPVPAVRSLVKQYFPLTLKQNHVPLSSKYHECRMFGTLMLVELYQRGDEGTQRDVVEHYLENTRFINNWDLVDCSAYKILGPHFLSRDRKDLKKLLQSKDLWERRIAMLTTLHFIKMDDYDDALDFAEQLITDQEDLMHKASGWMVREVGNRNLSVMESWLASRYKEMPRTMLRYAIEKMPKPRQQKYLKGVA